MTREQKLVDKGFEIDSQIKELNKALSEIKEELKQYASENKVEELVGKTAVAKFQPQSSTECSPISLYDKMKDLGMEDDFFGLVKVQVVQARKLLGESVFDKVSKSYTTPFAKISFKGI